MKYCNYSRYTLKFYNTLFAPGETKEVPGYINDNRMLAVPEQKQRMKPGPKPNSKPQTDIMIPNVQPDKESVKDN